MTLVPIIKSDDPFFNHEAAQKAANFVMKMDEDTARAFTTIVVGDVLEDTIEKNQRTLQRHLDDIVSKRIERFKKAALSAVSKSGDESALDYAEAIDRLEEIVKANPYQRNDPDWNESLFRRSSNGQFARKIKATQKTPFSDKRAKGMGIPTPKGLSDEQRARFQDEYRQVSDFLGTVHESSRDPAGNEIFLHIHNDKTKESYTVKPVRGHAVSERDWDPKNGERVIGVEARPHGLNIGGAAFGLSGAMGSDAVDRGVVEGLNRFDAKFTNFAHEWAGQNDTGGMKNSNERLYGRTKTAGTFLRDVAPDGSKAQMAGEFGRFVGEHGPEAERIVGPGMRKTAYRYRGTERKPDERVVDQYERAIRAEKQKHDPNRRAGQDRNPDWKNTPGRAVQQIAASRALADARPATFEERDAGRAVLTDYLGRHRQKNKKLFNLQLSSGVTPPSEGFMLDKNGKIVAQAIGYGDDHYLPFNLKNLKDLRGGEYIRNRSVGGPTSEDIYTGLMAGAKQLTVVSRSGTFTVTFEDDFKGGRRYNDKAKRMVNRYELLLDALESEQVDREPVPAHIQRQFQKEINDTYGADYPRAEKQQMLKDKIEEYKTSEGLTEEDEKYIDARVAQEVDRDPKVNEKQLRGQLVNDALSSKEYKFKLNGDGYRDALMSLEEQFPYYIKVKSVPKRDIDTFEPEKDRGYVMPAHNRPGAAQAGYFNARVRGATETLKNGKLTGKISAAEANYQNSRGPGAKHKIETTDTTAGDTGNAIPGAGTSGAPRTGTGTPISTDAAVEAIMERQEAGDVADSALELKKAAGDLSGIVGYPIVQLEDDEFRKKLRTPEGRLEFQKFVDAFKDSVDPNTRQPNGLRHRAKDQYVNYVKAANRIDRKQYNEKDSGVWTDKTWKFGGPEFKRNAPVPLIKKKIDELDKRSPAITAARPVSELSESEKKNELEKLVELKLNLPDLRKVPAGAARNQLLSDIGIGSSQSIHDLVNQGDKAIQVRINSLHQIRALQENLEARQRKGNGNGGTPPSAPSGGSGGGLSPTFSGGGGTSTIHTGSPRTVDDKTNRDAQAKIKSKLTELRNEIQFTPMQEDRDNIAQTINTGEAILRKAQQTPLTPDETEGWLDIARGHVADAKE